MTQPPVAGAGFGGARGFRNAPIAGSGSLVVGSIHSPNYVPGVSGWSINKDGTAQFNELTLIVQTSQAGILIYAGVAAQGTLIGSWAGQAGTDPYGNNYPAGLFAIQGLLAGLNIQNSTVLASLLTSCVLSDSQIQQCQLLGGTVTESVISFDTSGGALLMYASTTTTISQTASGTYTFTVPANVTQADVSCWGADAGGDGGSSSIGGAGSGGGGFSRNPTYPLVPGAVITYVVGDGSGGATTGGTAGDGGDSIWDLSVNGVVGSGGKAAPGTSAGGLGGAATSAPISWAGGNGGPVTASTGGGGGGGRAGSTGPGGNGIGNSGSTGGNGGTAGTGVGGHAGGKGGNNGANGVTGGGGGGAGAGSAVNTKTVTYNTDGTHTYQGSDGSNPNAKINDNSTMYQGGDVPNTYNGRSKTWIHFNAGNMASDFSGYTMTQAVVTLNNNHTWYNSGMTIHFGYTNRTTFPSTIGDPSGPNIDSKSWSIAEGVTTTKDVTSTGIASAFGAGTSNCIVLFVNSNVLTSYGFFAGHDQSGPPKIKLTGTKGTGNTTAGSGLDGRIDIVYTSGTTLMGSLSPVAGTDQYGNNYPAGYMGKTTAVDPVNGGAETWHDISLAAGWTLLSGEIAKYRLLPDGNVQVVCGLSHASFSAATTITNTALPAPYRTVSKQFIPGAVITQAGISIDSAGVIQAIPSGATTTCRANGTYQRDF